MILCFGNLVGACAVEFCGGDDRRLQFIALALASFIGAVLIIDMLSMGFTGIFGLIGLLIFLAVFAYPVIIGKHKLLLLPYGIIALTFTVFYIAEYPELIPFLLIIMGIICGLGAAMGKLINWFRSASRVKQASFVAIVLLVSIGIFFIMNANPLRGPDASVRAHVLRAMPIGTSIYDAVYIVENHRQWESSRRFGGLVHDRGIPLTRGGSPMLPYEGTADRWPPEQLIGEQSMVIYIGTYRTLFFGVPSSVEAFIAFDGDGELIEIFIGRLLHFP